MPCTWQRFRTRCSGAHPDTGLRRWDIRSPAARQAAAGTDRREGTRPARAWALHCLPRFGPQAGGLERISGRERRAFLAVGGLNAFRAACLSAFDHCSSRMFMVMLVRTSPCGPAPEGARPPCLACAHPHLDKGTRNDGKLRGVGWETVAYRCTATQLPAQPEGWARQGETIHPASPYWSSLDDPGIAHL